MTDHRDCYILHTGTRTHTQKHTQCQISKLPRHIKTMREQCEIIFIYSQKIIKYKDQSFSDALYVRLKKKNVSCFFHSFYSLNFTSFKYLCYKCLKYNATRFVPDKYITRKDILSAGYGGCFDERTHHWSMSLKHL